MNNNQQEASSEIPRRRFGLRSRAVIYLHESAEWQPTEDEMVSEAYIGQRKVCQQIARQLELEIVAFYQDWTPAEQQLRTDLERAIDRACQADVECLIVFSLTLLEGGQQDPIRIGWELGAAGTALVVAEQLEPELARRVKAL